MREGIKLLLEVLVVAVLGSAVGLAANSLRTGKRIELDRNYYAFQLGAGATGSKGGPAPLSTMPATVPVEPPTNVAGHSAEPAEKSFEQIAAELQSLGLQAIRHEDAVNLFNDPLYQAGGYIFIDARDDLSEGTIPGARQIHHFWSTEQINNAIDKLRPSLDAAQKIIVYCNGGNCTDSEATAAELLKHGIDPNKVYVYVEGFKKWQASGQRIAQGGAQ